MVAQVVHPDVARVKYDAEVTAFTQDADQYRRRGVFLARAEFPTVTVVFATPKLSPAAVLFGMRVDYTDYDLRPPSVRFVHPFDDHELTAGEMPTKFPRLENRPMPAALAQAVIAGGGPARVPLADEVPIAAMLDRAAVTDPPGPQPQLMMPIITELLQDYGPETTPFLCLAGTREYHEHPGHTGDPWELHRTTGAGSLARLINVVVTYGVEPAGGWAVQLAPTVTVGFGQPPA